MPRQNTSPSDYPRAVLRQIEQLGQHIAIARKRRGESQAQWAKKLGVSQPTMARIERGDPSVAMASYAMCLWLINQAEGLADLIAPVHDHAALEREVTEVRARWKPAPRASTAAPRPPSSSTAAALSPASDNAAGLAALLHPAEPPAA
ncbi:helix-turn-helix transcriptional regulator [Acidovorax sp. NCPPB 4044]|uniref:helix-turn-helix transcriptional regulator n=1 Tax=Acidovorax sp. NCPPB 4044 TaxID=2940490 RepID=UPI002303683C|nr:helix-turn-helix domain-containing protein [Acidovorax sp. NCPPB 4044]MDA8522046.1 helix-turn-helix domain-containing protein [Acidovorax sp. NCPPB 4044]